MKLKCLIVDDEINSAESIRECVQRNPNLELIGVETDNKEALNKLMEKQITPDIIFLDIMMPELDGIEFASQIKGLARIIFVAGDKSRALDAFEQDGMDYIIKPVSDSRLAKAVEKALEWYKGKISQEENDRLIIQESKKGQFQVIDLKELLFVESSSNYVTFKMMDNKSYIAYMTLKAIEDKLKGLSFRRVHKTFVINLHQMKSIANGTIFLVNGYRIPIGPKYRDKFMNEVISKKLLG